MFSFVEFKVRLIGDMSNYSGCQGAFEFENGVSVRKLHRNEVSLLPAIGFPCEAVDDNGEPVFEVVAGEIPMPDSALEEVRKEFISSRKVQDVKKVAIANGETFEDDTLESSGVEITREELEAIADKSGLKGLRKVGDELGIKGKSIPEIINRIMQTQG